jgi:DNA polymerase III alpha subunit
MDYVIRKYGSQVAQIITYGKMATKSVDDTQHVCWIYHYLKPTAKLIPHDAVQVEFSTLLNEE